MASFEFCTMARKSDPQVAKNLSNEQPVQWWVELHLLSSQGAVEVIKTPIVSGQGLTVPPAIDQAQERLTARLQSQGWQPLEGGFYRQSTSQPKGNGQARSSGSELDRMLGLVMERTGQGQLETQAGNIMRDMLIELITSAAVDPALSAPPEPINQSDTAPEYRAGKLDARQLERRQAREKPRHKNRRPADTQEYS